MHGVLKAGVVPVLIKHILTRRVITYTEEDLLKLKRKSLVLQNKNFKYENLQY
jgi:hypothetical protein